MGGEMGLAGRKWGWLIAAREEEAAAAEDAMDGIVAGRGGLGVAVYGGKKVGLDRAKWIRY